MPKPTPEGRPQGEARMPESMRRQEAEAEADARRAPAGRGPGWPESMRSRKPKPTPVGAPEGREAQDGRARQLSSLADILADARVWKLKDASAAPTRPVWSTGKSSLDARLPGVGGRRRRSSRYCWTIPAWVRCSFFLPRWWSASASGQGKTEAPWLSGLHRLMNPMPLH